MRKERSGKTSFLVIAAAVFITVALGWPGQAFTADWVYTHGHSGSVQSPGNVTGLLPMGWGLQFAVKPGVGTWVHYAVPTTTKSGTKQYAVRHLRLKFTTGSVDAYLRHIHVWDGNVRFVTLSDVNLSEVQDIKIDLGQNWNVYRGLGVSLEFVAGVESMSHQVEIQAVGAQFK